jgi:2,4-didehydro-3-deoxy-L-rhamnonate hydrolase
LRLVRFGPMGEERPGVLARDGSIHDASALVEDWTAAALSREALARWAALDVAALPLAPPGVRLGVPVTGTRKFLGIGLNFKDFATENNRPLPAEPALFSKAVSCLCGPNDAIRVPRASTRTDWEVELGVVIGAEARYVSANEALGYIAGYVLVNDITERDFSNNRGGTWDKGKGCDTFGPVGPWLVTADEILDPQDVDLWLEVNGVRYQDGHTREMIFSVADLVAHVSGFMTLEPGDILTTGTPAGVGMALKPQARYLKAGDVMRLGSRKLGVQEHRVESWRTL